MFYIPFTSNFVNMDQHISKQFHYEYNDANLYWLEISKCLKFWRF